MAETLLKTSFESFGDHCRTTVSADGLTGFPGLFYEIEGAIVPERLQSANFALLAVLHLAMRQGADIRCLDPIDADLIPQLEECQDAWARWCPHLFRPVRIFAERLNAPALPRDRTAVLAFSGGLDSSYALHAHRRGLLGARTLDIVSGVLVHGLDIPIDRPDIFASARKRAESILTAYGVPLTTVRTNWRDLPLPWEQSFMFALTSVMSLFAGTVSRAVISPDDAYDSELPGWGSNSTTNQMLSAPAFPIQFTGAGTSRIQKAAALSSERPILENIRVCWEHPESMGNCGRCEKCVRTKLNFMAVGVTEFPGLGAPPTPREVGRLRVKRQTTLPFYREILERGDWTPEMRRALRTVIRKGVPHRHGPLMRRLSRKLTRFARKRVR